MKGVRSVIMNRLLLLLSASLIHLQAFAGSPFYFTVERSYAPDESPEIRMDFLKKSEPLVLRILRPKNLESFLDGQLNISRSYEEPVSSINPGHYVSEGINDTASPLSAFRELLNPQFRVSVRPSGMDHSLRETEAGDLVTSPMEIVHGAPKGFEVVREMYIDLQKGGAATDSYNYSWGDDSEEDSEESTSYQVRTLVLDPLPDGVYLVQGLQEDIEAQVLLQVSSLALQVKQSSTQLIARVIDRHLNPVKDAKLEYRDGRGKWQALSGLTDAAGQLRFDNPEGILDGKLVIRVTSGDKQQALLDTDFLPATVPDQTVFIVTDRPIFKPGETFFYKGTIRDLKDGKVDLPDIAGKTAEVSLLRSDGSDTNLRGSASITDFRSFSGSFDLSQNEVPGLYRLIASVDGKPYAGEFRVKDYVKPVFYLEFTEKDPAIVPGQKFHFKMKARRYSGGVPQGVKYEVFVYRKKFEVPSFVAESGGGLEAGHDYIGDVRSVTPLSQPERVYSSAEARYKDQAFPVNPWENAPSLDENGEASVEIEIPASTDKEKDREWTYTLMVRAVNALGSQAVMSENFYATLSEAVASVSLMKSIVEPGSASIKAYVSTSYPDGDPAQNGHGELRLVLVTPDGTEGVIGALPFSSDDKGRAEIDVPVQKNPGLLKISAYLDRIGERKLPRAFTSDPVMLVVGGTSGEAVSASGEIQLFTDRTILSPGESVKVFAALPPAWGNAESGTLWETVAGTKIFDVKSRDVHGRSTWLDLSAKPEYGTGFYETVTIPAGKGKYQEETLGFRIVPKDKRLSISVMPEKDTAEPLKPFVVRFKVLDVSNAPAADTELSVNVVDRAVYAVQPEFRPQILDFVYPLPKLNLATFYSDDLQGYGFAARIRKPNFSLGAIKSRQQPPKRDMRDTAGWFPHVVTDAEGMASVKVDMPANITEWIVTAIAADKTGRAGEARGSFRSVTDVNIEAQIPGYLRQGDEAKGGLELINSMSKAVTIRTEVQAEGAVSLEGERPGADIGVDANGRRIIPVTLKAADSAGAGLLSIGLSSAEPLHLGGQQAFDIAVRSAALPQTVEAERSVDAVATSYDFSMPVGAVPSSLDVIVSRGLLGLALQAAENLVSYPYGCTEQLVHSTIPNLVLMDLLEKAGIDQSNIDSRFTGLTAKQFSEARNNAQAGIARIIRNQKSTGGFGLWPNDPESGRTVTLIAMQALGLASDLEIPGAKASLESASNWMNSYKGDLSFYDLSIAAGIGFPYALHGQYQDVVEKVAENRNASLEDLVQAYRIVKGQEKYKWYYEDSGSFMEMADKLPPRIKASLASFSDQKGEALAKQFPDNMGIYRGPAPVIADALAILSETDQLDDKVKAKAMRLLVDSFHDGMWNSTYDTALIIFTLRDLLKQEAETAKAESASPQVSVKGSDGKELMQLKAVPGGFTGRLDSISDPAAVQSISFEGPLPGSTQVKARLQVQVPYESVAETANGITLTRTLLRIGAKGSELIDLSTPLHSGDIVVSKVHVKREDRGRGWWWQPRPSNFIVVQDGVPSAAESLEDEKTYLADAGLVPNEATYMAKLKDTMRYPDRVERVVEINPGGEMDVFQVWRITYKGKAAVPPVRAFDMYRADISANTASGAMIVE